MRFFLLLAIANLAFSNAGGLEILKRRVLSGGKSRLLQESCVEQGWFSITSGNTIAGQLSGATTWEFCNDACASNSSCGAWAWRSGSHATAPNTCHLGTSAGAFTADAGHVGCPAQTCRDCSEPSPTQPPTQTSPPEEPSPEEPSPTQPPTQTSPPEEPTPEEPDAPYTYLGCFADASDRALDGEQYRPDDLTVESCYEFCANAGYQYFGVQYSSQCYCGNSGYDRYGPATNCQNTCDGDSAQICGGSWASNVYIIGEPPSPPSPICDNVYSAGWYADADCCTEDEPCEIYNGDCDSDAECEGDLICGTDNCVALGIASWPDSTYDCCVPSVEEWPVLSQSGNLAQNRFLDYRGAFNSEGASSVLNRQNSDGGWGKDGAGSRSTFDNGATIKETVYMAQQYQNSGNSAYRDSVRRAVRLILDAQYPSGGIPQYYPLRGGYSNRATFNDHAMSSALGVLHNAAQGHATFNGIFNAADRAEIKAAVDLGVEFILRAQWVQNGTLTGWCAQHNENTYLPASARDYELESLSGNEATEVVAFLMTQPQSPRIRDAVQAAVWWFKWDETILTGYRYDTGVDEKFVSSSGSRLWYRFYDLNTNQGIFSDRTGGKFYDIMDIQKERRDGYRWAGGWGQSIINYANSVGYNGYRVYR